jgi:WD40-like Beta Propeller Repeat
MMPMFSPDGKKIVFNDTDNHMGHSLMVQDFDAATNTFSNPVTIYNDTNGKYPGWPFFTPDSGKVIFVLGAAANFSSIPPASFSDIGPVQAAATDVSTGDLYVVDMASPGTAYAMDLANGYRNGASYLPFPGRDEHLNFYPTGSPVAAGGYFWAFFTSRRQYGNVMTDSSSSSGGSGGSGASSSSSGSGAIPDPVFHAETKKIWVTAIGIDAVGDPSHPAFYLPGQEAPSGNIRAFAALAPCAANGASCVSGIDCCGGYCTNGSCNKPSTCSTVDNKCTTTADCCMGSGLTCIGGFCATIVQ